MRLSNAILRGVSGAFLLQAGLGKKDLPEEAYAGLRDMASTGIPQFKEWDAKTFGNFIWMSEVGIGALLVTPFVNKRVAGAALTAFAAGMLSMYFNNDDMTQDDGIRPSQAGTPLAKDSWLAAIGLALMVQGRK